MSEPKLRHQRWQSLHKKAIAELARGEVESARESIQQLTTFSQEQLGHYHPQTIKTLILSALMSLSDNTHSKAVDLLVDARTRLKAAYDDQHPLLAEVLGALGNVYTQQLLYREAQGAYQGALEILKANFGDGHPQHSALLLALGDTLRLQHKYDQARNLYGNALANAKSIDEDRSFVLRINSKLGLLSLVEQKYEQCCALLEEAVSTAEHAEEGQIPELVLVEINSTLGQAYYMLGDNDNAKVHLTQVTQYTSLTDYSSQQMTLEAALLLEEIYIADGAYQAALEMCKHRCQLTREYCGEYSTDFAHAMESCGSLLVPLKDYQNARSYWLNAVEILAELYEEGHAIFANLYHNLGSLELSCGILDEAQQYLLQALKAYEQGVDRDLVGLARTHFALGKVYVKSDQSEQAQQHFMHVLEVDQSAAQELPTLVEQALLEVRTLNANPQEQASETDIYQVDELDLSNDSPAATSPDENQSHTNPTHQQMGESVTADDQINAVGALYHSALVCLNQLQYPAAIEKFEEILELVDQHKLGDSPEIVKLLESIADVFKQLGKQQRAEEFLQRAQTGA